MGSGLILLVIVGAWLAVLVPMALRSHDASTSLSSVDRFSDAMRVLSRREQAGRGSARTFVVPRRPVASYDEPVPVPIEVRRRRVLLVLVGLVAFVLLLGLAGVGSPLLALVPAALAVAYVVHLRRQAILKAERLRRSAAAGRRRAPQQRRAVPRVRIAGIPDRMPARPAPLTAPLPAPAARYEDPQPVSASASGSTSSSTWSPTAFPVPTYVTAPVAPPRPPRVLDLTRPGEWSAALEAGELLDVPGEDELDDILDTRRASGDW